MSFTSQFTFRRIGPAPVAEHAEQYLVRTRDGVRLATDVYLPERAGSAEGAWAGGCPTVLVRLPYDKNSRYVYFDRVARLFTDRRYALAVQDVRGKFRSGGATVPFLRESADGYDTLDWIVQQPWSDGRVGMFGDSYYGFTQWAAVASQHPALRAIVPRVTAADFHTIWRPPGQRAPVWLEGIEYFAHHWIDRDSYDFTVDRARRPVIEGYEEAFRAIGARSLWFDLMAPRQAGLATQQGLHPFDARPVPVLHCVGWYDNIGAAHMRDYVELASRPGWDAVQYLWAGAVDHENYHLDHAPVGADDDHNVSEEALDRMLPGYAGPALDFFDVFLKGSRPVSSLAKVSWELGHEGWHTSAAWPPADAETRSLWLAAPERAGGALPGGQLVEAPRGVEGTADVGACAEWIHDPDVPVPSLAEDSFAYLRSHPDLAPVAARDDVLVFTGPELAEPWDLAGPVGAELYVSGSAPEFDVFVKVLDVGEDGTARVVVRGQAAVGPHRDGGAGGEGVCAAGAGGEEDRAAGGPAVARLRIDLGHTGYRVRAGHRVALMVTGSDFPLFLPATGTGESAWTAVSGKPVTQGLHTGGARPSRLTLSVLPSATG